MHNLNKNSIVQKNKRIFPTVLNLAAFLLVLLPIARWSLISFVRINQLILRLLLPHEIRHDWSQSNCWWEPDG